MFSDSHRLVIIQWLDKFIEPDIKCRGCTEVAIFISNRPLPQKLSTENVRVSWKVNTTWETFLTVLIYDNSLPQR